MQGRARIQTIPVQCFNEKCGKTYDVKYSKSIKGMNKILDYSVCSHCGVARNPNLHTSDRKECRYPECHTPAVKGRNGLCLMHYMRRYKKLHKKQVSIK